MNQGRLDHDYDGFWKGALDEFLLDALAFLAPEVLEHIDTTQPVVSLDKELQALVPTTRAGCRFVDKLFQARSRGGDAVTFLLHVEIQSERDADLERRMFTYRYRLFDVHALDVATLVVLADDDAEWRPTRFERRFLRDRLLFEFQSVKLLDLAPQLEELARLENPFALLVAAYLRTRRSHPDRSRLRFKYEVVCAICERGEPMKRARQLLRLVDWLMRLPDELTQEFRVAVRDYAERKNMPILMDLEIEAMEKGRVEGRVEGRNEGRVEGEILAFRTGIVRILELRFGAGAPELAAVTEKLGSLSDLDALHRLHEQAVVAGSIAEFGESLGRVSTLG